MTTKNENFTLPNGCVLTPEAMTLLYQLQFNQGHLNFNGEKNQDIAMYSNLITKVQDRIAESAHKFGPDEHDEWRNTLLHIADLVDIKRIINVFSHPDRF